MLTIKIHLKVMLLLLLIMVLSSRCAHGLRSLGAAATSNTGPSVHARLPAMDQSMHSCNYVCQHLDILHAFDHGQSQMFNRKENTAL